MPLYVVDKITGALNDKSKAVRGSRIVVLGVAYKPDVNDVRESPALDVIELLRQKGGDVVYHDPHVPNIRFDGGKTMESRSYSSELLDDADCVVIITNHRWYDWEDVLAHSTLVVDTRNALSKYDTDATIVGL